MVDGNILDDLFGLSTHLVPGKDLFGINLEASDQLINDIRTCATLPRSHSMDELPLHNERERLGILQDDHTSSTHVHSTAGLLSASPCAPVDLRQVSQEMPIYLLEEDEGNDEEILRLLVSDTSIQMTETSSSTSGTPTSESPSSILCNEESNNHLYGQPSPSPNTSISIGASTPINTIVTKEQPTQKSGHGMGKPHPIPELVPSIKRRDKTKPDVQSKCYGQQKNCQQNSMSALTRTKLRDFLNQKSTTTKSMPVSSPSTPPTFPLLALVIPPNMATSISSKSPSLLPSSKTSSPNTSLLEPITPQTLKENNSKGTCRTVPMATTTVKSSTNKHSTAKNKYQAVPIVSIEMVDSSANKQMLTKRTKRKHGGGWTKGKKRKTELELLKPPRPPLTSYGAFVRENQSLATTGELSMQQVSKKLGQIWGSLTQEMKDDYQIKATEDQQRFKCELKDYLWKKFQGLSSKSDISILVDKVIEESLPDDDTSLYCNLCHISFCNLSRKHYHFCGRPHTEELLSKLKKMIPAKLTLEERIEATEESSSESCQTAVSVTDQTIGVMPKDSFNESSLNDTRIESEFKSLEQLVSSFCSEPSQTSHEEPKEVIKWKDDNSSFQEESPVINDQLAGNEEEQEDKEEEMMENETSTYITEEEWIPTCSLPPFLNNLAETVTIMMATSQSLISEEEVEKELLEKKWKLSDKICELELWSSAYFEELNLLNQINFTYQQSLQHLVHLLKCLEEKNL